MVCDIMDKGEAKDAEPDDEEGEDEEDGTFSTYTIRDRMAGIKPVVLHFDDPRKLLLSPALSRLVGASFKASQPSITTICATIYKGVSISVHRHTAAI